MKQIVFAAASATAAAVAMTTIFTGLAEAAPTDHGQCGRADVQATVVDGGVGVGSHYYSVELTAKPGVSCQIGGSPQGNRFLDANNNPVPVATESANPTSWDEVTIDATHPAEFSIKTPNAPGVRASSLQFNLPSGAEDAMLTIPWTPGAIAGPAEFGVVTATN